jgi:hypothetical protein
MCHVPVYEKKTPATVQRETARGRLDLPTKTPYLSLEMLQL